MNGGNYVGSYLIPMKYEILPGIKAKPVFRSYREYQKALDEFYQGCLPEFKKQREARRKTMEDVLKNPKVYKGI